MFLNFENQIINKTNVLPLPLNFEFILEFTNNH